MSNQQEEKRATRAGIYSGNEAIRHLQNDRARDKGRAGFGADRAGDVFDHRFWAYVEAHARVRREALAETLSQSQAATAGAALDGSRGGVPNCETV